MPITNFPFKKILSALTLFFFLASQSALGMTSVAVNISASVEVPLTTTIEIPQDLANIEAVYTPEATPNPRLVFHIQDAHSHYEAQVQIKKLLAYLTEQYGLKNFFIEGAAEELDARLLKLFPDAKRNLALADYLAQKGEMTGADLYLMEHDGVRAIGIEDPDLYRHNYEALRKVYDARGDIENFSKNYEQRLDALTSKVFSNDSRRLIGDWKRFEQGQREFLPYLRGLSEEAKKILDLDLGSLFSQVEWPQLTRLLTLQSMEKELNREAAVQEKEKLVAFLESKKVAPSLIEDIKRLDLDASKIKQMVYGGQTTRLAPRDLLEKLIQEAGPKGFRFYDYAAFSLYAGYIILLSELDTRKLFEEIETLFENMLGELSKTATEQTLLEIYRDGQLLKKFLDLELSREEWTKLLDRRERLTPEAMISRLGNAEEKIRLETGKKLTEKTFKEPRLKSLAGAFENAARFYEIALEREGIFYRKLDQIMKAQGLKKAALITGGFHTEGLSEYFQKARIGYVTLSPRLRGDFKESRTHYREAMLQSRKTLFDLATMQIVSYLQLLRTQGRQGADPRSRFKSLVDAYATVAGITKPSIAEAQLRTQPLAKELADIGRSELRGKKTEEPFTNLMALAFEHAAAKTGEFHKPTEGVPAPEFENFPHSEHPEVIAKKQVFRQAGIPKEQWDQILGKVWQQPSEIVELALESAKEGGLDTSRPELLHTILVLLEATMGPELRKKGWTTLGIVLSVRKSTLQRGQDTPDRIGVLQVLRDYFQESFQAIVKEISDRNAARLEALKKNRQTHINEYLYRKYWEVFKISSAELDIMARDGFLFPLTPAEELAEAYRGYLKLEPETLGRLVVGNWKIFLGHAGSGARLNLPPREVLTSLGVTQKEAAYHWLLFFKMLTGHSNGSRQDLKRKLALLRAAGVPEADLISGLAAIVPFRYQVLQFIFDRAKKMQVALRNSQTLIQLYMDTARIYGERNPKQTLFKFLDSIEKASDRNTRLAQALDPILEGLLKERYQKENPPTVPTPKILIDALYGWIRQAIETVETKLTDAEKTAAQDAVYQRLAIKYEHKHSKSTLMSLLEDTIRTYGIHAVPEFEKMIRTDLDSAVLDWWEEKSGAKSPAPVVAPIEAPEKIVPVAPVAPKETVVSSPIGIPLAPLVPVSAAGVKKPEAVRTPQTRKPSENKGQKELQKLIDANFEMKKDGLTVSRLLSMLNLTAAIAVEQFTSIERLWFRTNAIQLRVMGSKADLLRKAGIKQEHMVAVLSSLRTVPVVVLEILIDEFKDLNLAPPRDLGYLYRQLAEKVKSPTLAALIRELEKQEKPNQPIKEKLRQRIQPMLDALRREILPDAAPEKVTPPKEKIEKPKEIKTPAPKTVPKATKSAPVKALPPPAEKPAVQQTEKVPEGTSVVAVPEDMRKRIQSLLKAGMSLEIAWGSLQQTLGVNLGVVELVGQIAETQKRRLENPNQLKRINQQLNQRLQESGLSSVKVLVGKNPVILENVIRPILKDVISQILPKRSELRSDESPASTPSLGMPRVPISKKTKLVVDETYLIRKGKVALVREVEGWKTDHPRLVIEYVGGVRETLNTFLIVPVYLATPEEVRDAKQMEAKSSQTGPVVTVDKAWREASEMAELLMSAIGRDYGLPTEIFVMPHVLEKLQWTAKKDFPKTFSENESAGRELLEKVVREETERYDARVKGELSLRTASGVERYILLELLSPFVAALDFQWSDLGDGVAKLRALRKVRSQLTLEGKIKPEVVEAILRKVRIPEDRVVKISSTEEPVDIIALWLKEMREVHIKMILEAMQKAVPNVEAILQKELPEAFQPEPSQAEPLETVPSVPPSDTVAPEKSEKSAMTEIPVSVEPSVEIPVVKPTMSEVEKLRIQRHLARVSQDDPRTLLPAKIQQVLGGIVLSRKDAGILSELIQKYGETTAVDFIEKVEDPSVKQLGVTMSRALAISANHHVSPPLSVEVAVAAEHYETTAESVVKWAKLWNAMRKQNLPPDSVTEIDAEWDAISPDKQAEAEEIISSLLEIRQDHASTMERLEIPKMLEFCFYRQVGMDLGELETAIYEETFWTDLARAKRGLDKGLMYSRRAVLNESGPASGIDDGHQSDEPPDLEDEEAYKSGEENRSELRMQLKVRRDNVSGDIKTQTANLPETIRDVLIETGTLGNYNKEDLHYLGSQGQFYSNDSVVAGIRLAKELGISARLIVETAQRDKITPELLGVRLRSVRDRIVSMRQKSLGQQALLKLSPAQLEREASKVISGILDLQYTYQLLERDREVLSTDRLLRLYEVALDIEKVQEMMKVILRTDLFVWEEKLNRPYSLRQERMLEKLKDANQGRGKFGPGIDKRLLDRSLETAEVTEVTEQVIPDAGFNMRRTGRVSGKKKNLTEHVLYGDDILNGEAKQVITGLTAEGRLFGAGDVLSKVMRILRAVRSEFGLSHGARYFIQLAENLGAPVEVEMYRNEYTVKVDITLLSLSPEELQAVVTHALRHVRYVRNMAIEDSQGRELAAYFEEAWELLRATPQERADLNQALQHLGKLGWETGAHLDYLQGIERAAQNKSIVEFLDLDRSSARGKLEGLDPTLVREVQGVKYQISPDWYLMSGAYLTGMQARAALRRALTSEEKVFAGQKILAAARREVPLEMAAKLSTSGFLAPRNDELLEVMQHFSLTYRQARELLNSNHELLRAIRINGWDVARPYFLFNSTYEELSKKVANGNSALIFRALTLEGKGEMTEPRAYRNAVFAETLFFRLFGDRDPFSFLTEPLNEAERRILFGGIYDALYPSNLPERKMKERVLRDLVLTGSGNLRWFHRLSAYAEWKGLVNDVPNLQGVPKDTAEQIARLLLRIAEAQIYFTEKKSFGVSTQQERPSPESSARILGAQQQLITQVFEQWGKYIGVFVGRPEFEKFRPVIGAQRRSIAVSLKNGETQALNEAGEMLRVTVLMLEGLGEVGSGDFMTALRQRLAMVSADMFLLPLHNPGGEFALERTIFSYLMAIRDPEAVADMSRRLVAEVTEFTPEFDIARKGDVHSGFGPQYSPQSTLEYVLNFLATGGVDRGEWLTLVSYVLGDIYTETEAGVRRNKETALVEALRMIPESENKSRQILEIISSEPNVLRTRETPVLRDYLMQVLPASVIAGTLKSANIDEASAVLSAVPAAQVQSVVGEMEDESRGRDILYRDTYRRHISGKPRTLDNHSWGGKLPNHFTTLGVPRQATLGEIQDSYRKLSFAFHPGRLAHEAPAVQAAAAEQFRLIKEAYDVIYLGRQQQEERIKKQGVATAPGAETKAPEVKSKADQYMEYVKIIPKAATLYLSETWMSKLPKDFQRAAWAKPEGRSELRQTKLAISKDRLKVGENIRLGFDREALGELRNQLPAVQTAYAAGKLVNLLKIPEAQATTIFGEMLAMQTPSVSTATTNLLNDLDANIGQLKTASTIGMVLPEKLDQELIPAYLAGFLEGLTPGQIAEILKSGARLPDAAQAIVNRLKLSIRSVKTSMPAVLKGDKQTSVPSALLETPAKLDAMFLPFEIESLDALKGDKDAAIWFGRLTSRALIHLADLNQDARYAGNAKLLKETLIQRLNLEGFDNGFLSVRGAGFKLNAALAQKIFHEKLTAEALARAA